MGDKIDWKIIGDNGWHRKFIIPIKDLDNSKLRKWWQIWKSDKKITTTNNNIDDDNDFFPDQKI